MTERVHIVYVEYAHHKSSSSILIEGVCRERKDALTMRRALKKRLDSKRQQRAREVVGIFHYGADILTVPLT